jgi:predicted lipoprotein with Yx(FWY)xxD motif
MTLAVAACGSSASSSSSATPSTSATVAASGTAAVTTLMAMTVLGMNLVVKGGFVVFWYSLDTAKASKCNETCTITWSPVQGPAAAGDGVTGELGIFTRSDGTTQATYDGHQLYLYTGDQTKLRDNGYVVKASHGVWYPMLISGATPSPSAAATPGGGS